MFLLCLMHFQEFGGYSPKDAMACNGCGFSLQSLTSSFMKFIESIVDCRFLSFFDVCSTPR
jgi:hypothetical protein